MGRTVYIYLHENRKPIGNQQNSWIGKYTPRKFNMEPEKESLEKEIPFGKHHLSFSGSMLNFGGVPNSSHGKTVMGPVHWDPGHLQG